MRCLLFCCTLLLTIAGEGRAQQFWPSGLGAGTRVRISAPDAVAGRVTGHVREVSGDALTLVSDPAGELLVLPVTAVASIERSLGRSRGAGARRGLLIGGVAGVGLGLACVSVCGDGGGGANLAPVGGLFYGPLVGAALGALIASERWQRLPFPTR